MLEMKAGCLISTMWRRLKGCPDFIAKGCRLPLRYAALEEGVGAMEGAHREAILFQRLDLGRRLIFSPSCYRIAED